MRSEARWPERLGPVPLPGDRDHGACASRRAWRRALTESDGLPAEAGASWEGPAPEAELAAAIVYGDRGDP